MEGHLILKEMNSAIKGLGLDSVVVGDYLVVLRSNIDVTIEGEPYLALMILLHLKSKAFFARIWNETVTVGNVSNVEEFLEVCKSHFSQCLGCPEYGFKENIHKLFPLKRNFSQFCQKVVTDSNVASCAQCLGMLAPKDEDNKFDSATVCKVENGSDPEDNGILSWSNKEISNEDQNFSQDAFSDDIKNVCLDSILKTEVKFVSSEEELSNASDEVLDELLDDSLDQEMFEGMDEELKKKRVKKVYKKVKKNKAEKQASKEKDGKFKCPWCQLRIKQTSIVFVTHKKKEHYWGEFKCRQCEYVGDFAKDLINHMGAEGHMDNPLVCCPNCKWNAQISEIEDHYKDCVKNALMVKCEICNYRSKTLSIVYKHMKRAHFWGVFKCGGCKNKYHYFQELLDHAVQYAHNQEVNCPTASCKMKMKVEEVGPHYEKCISRHLSEIIRNTNKRARAKKKVCECGICGKKLPETGLKNHQEHCTKLAGRKICNVEREERTYCCEYCGKQYSGKNAQVGYLQHKKNSHEKNEKCLICGYRFGTKQMLKRHMQRHEDPQFKCSFCGKMLKTNGRLVAHERAHTGENPFQCTVCGKSFTDQAALGQHKRLVHQITGPRAKPMKRELQRGITEFKIQ